MVKPPETEKVEVHEISRTLRLDGSTEVLYDNGLTAYEYPISEVSEEFRVEPYKDFLFVKPGRLPKFMRRKYATFARPVPFWWEKRFTWALITGLLSAVVTANWPF